MNVRMVPTSRNIIQRNGTHYALLVEAIKVKADEQGDIEIELQQLSAGENLVVLY